MILKGNSVNPLNGSNQVILTESFARALLGDADSVGKILQLNSKIYVTVSSVIEDPPSNTQFDFQHLFSWDYTKRTGNYGEFWGNNSVAIFAQLLPGADLSVFNNKINNITIEHSKGDHRETSEVFALLLKTASSMIKR